MSGSFSANLIGTTDIPTVIVPNPGIQGPSMEKAPITLGGDTTDTDAISLGRTQSESICKLPLRLPMPNWSDANVHSNT